MIEISKVGERTADDIEDFYKRLHCKRISEKIEKIFIFWLKFSNCCNSWVIKAFNRRSK